MVERSGRHRGWDSNGSGLKPYRDLSIFVLWRCLTRDEASVLESKAERGLLDGLRADKAGTNLGFC
jgi:hypothetical protein